MSPEEKENIQADIINKLSPIKNLLAILKSSEWVYHQDPLIHKLAEQEVKQSEESIEYLSNIL